MDGMTFCFLMLGDALFIGKPNQPQLHDEGKWTG